VVVQHGSGPIKAEAIEVKLLHPVTNRGEQKLLHLPLTVVEQLGVPTRMVSAVAGMKVTIFGAIKLIEALIDIFYGMGMYQVHDDGYPHAVSCIDQGFELLRCPKPRRRCKKVGYVVAKGTVIRMLHHCHELNGVLARSLDARKDVFFKFKVGPYPLFFLRHAHVAFVDKRHGGGFF